MSTERLIHIARQILPQVTVAPENGGYRVSNGEKEYTVHGDRCSCGQETCLHRALVQVWQQEKGRSQTPHSGPPNGRRNGGPAAAQADWLPPAVPDGRPEWSPALYEALARPFPAHVVGWKAQSTNRERTRALAVAYVDARAVMDRLDEAVGPDGWKDAYSILGEQSGIFGNEVVVECRLTILGVTKCDVGIGEDAKSAYSDAFKRAAVKFGIARYLYSLPKTWVAYDDSRKQLLETPTLPAWALP